MQTKHLKIVSYYLLLIFGVLIIISFGWQKIKTLGQELLPIKYVRVEGVLQFIEKNKIKQAIKQQVNNGLYNVNLSQIQQLIKQLSWVKDVTVKRVWPDTITIKIIEQTPVARWKDGYLLSQQGNLFVSENISKFIVLPLLIGTAGEEKKILQIMQELTIALHQHNMRLAEFSINQRSAWNMKLANGMQLKLGRNNPLDKFYRFLSTLSLLGSHKTKKIIVADLRYQNGYALEWRAGENLINWK